MEKKGTDRLERLMKEHTEVEKVLFRRRSVRLYRKEQVPEFMIKRILEAGRFAPSAGNCQPWKFVVVRDPELIRGMEEFCVEECKKLSAGFDYTNYPRGTFKHFVTGAKAKLLGRLQPNMLHPVPVAVMTLIVSLNTKHWALEKVAGYGFLTMIGFDLASLVWQVLPARRQVTLKLRGIALTSAIQVMVNGAEAAFESAYDLASESLTLSGLTLTPRDRLEVVVAGAQLSGRERRKEHLLRLLDNFKLEINTLSALEAAADDLLAGQLALETFALKDAHVTALRSVVEITP